MIDTPPPLGTAELARVLLDWLPGQRWFAGKQRPVESVRPRYLAAIGASPDLVQIWVADVTYFDSTVETYQIPLRVGAGAAGAEQGRVDAEQGRVGEVHGRVGDVHGRVGDVHGRVGEVPGPDGGTVTVYDAMSDRSATQAWLLGLAPDGDAPTGSGSPDSAVAFHRTGEVADIPLGAPSRMQTGEQSNTSVVYGDRAILKVFRRLETGINPDIEIHEALGRLGGRHIARLLGYVTADLSAGLGHFQQVSAESQGDHAHLAMLQAYMTTATDGWELAKISVRDLMAEADLHASEAGGDFAAEAFRLGVATAEVHADLGEAFGQKQLDREQMRARAGEMSDRLDDALTVVPQLADSAPALRECYRAFAEAEPMVVQRVHGDLHLGQVLRTVQRWVVLDFEGEPVKAIAARREMDSPLRDVAGMLRSFDYAANHQMIDTGLDNQRRYRATEWADRNRSAFQTGYAHTGRPDATGRHDSTAGRGDGADPVLLRAFEADKAVYEAVYEARNRPAWLAVPLASLHRLAVPAVSGSADREDMS